MPLRMECLLVKSSVPACKMITQKIFKNAYLIIKKNYIKVRIVMLIIMCSILIAHF